MKRWGVLLAIIGLTACAPASLTTWGTNPHGATVQVTADRVTLSSGDEFILSGTLFLWGKNLRVNEPTCRVVGQHIECNLPKLAPRKLFVLPVTGENIVAEALVNRIDGQFWAVRKEK